MRFAHMADLHIGKKLGPFELIEDQRAALDGALSLIQGANADAVFLAGDIYDRSVPSSEAVSLADEFLTKLASVAPVYAVSGNHDSPERLAFGRRLMRGQGLIIAGAYEGRMEKYTVSDARGEIDIWLLPFVRPRETERFFEGASFETADAAVRAIIARDPPTRGRRNILVTHQFVTAAFERPVLSDSEVNPVGGLTEVSAEALYGYDYAALGHLHAPQKAGRASVRYAGSLLKYSFSEEKHHKSLVVGDMDESGRVSVSLLPIPCPRGMRSLSGAVGALTSPEFLSEICADDYVSITLEGEIPASPMDALGAAYSHIVRLSLPARGEAALQGARGSAVKSPMALFSDFYRAVTGEEISSEMLALADEAMAQAREGGEA